MPRAEIHVTVYFAICGTECELVSNDRAAVERFVATFNRLRLESMGTAELREKRISV